MRDRRDEQRRWQDEKRREQQAKLTERRAREAKKIRNREYTIVSYFFVCIFISLVVYMVYFELEKKDSIINSPYNTRQDQFEDRVVRGSILSADGQTLAYTQVNEDETETRIYPFNNLFAHIVGYDSNGKNGLESLANFELMTSHDGYVKQVKNEMQETKNQGDNVVTTLNTSLQQTAYDALGDNQGAVVVMDPKSGAVLAMVSKPDFNPNTVSQDWDYLTSDSSNSSLLNRATQGAYPPGSVFKIVTTLAYLRSENGNLDNFTYTCDGSITVDDHTISCYDGEEHGTEDFETAFAESCNSAFANLGMELGAKKLTSAAESLLFNKKLPISISYNSSKFDLGEHPGNPLLMQTSIGQGNTLVSPMHMALIVSAIANDGVLMKPYYIQQVQNVNGDVVSKTKTSEYKTLMTKEEASRLKQLMQAVVNRGTASALSGESYSAAGKTGSAEYYGSDGSIHTHSWFVGMAENDESQLVVAVIAEGAGTGSSVAVPIAHQIFNQYYY